MRSVRDVHVKTAKILGHPIVKDSLTHSGVAGLFMDALHAILGRFPAILETLWAPVAHAVAPVAALALGLVVYSDNAHHFTALIESKIKDEGEKPVE